MDKKNLGIKLSNLKALDKLNINLEQYQIDGNLASDLLWLAYINDDIKDKVVADLGCGNGILGIGALLLGAKFVYFLDIDENALDVCKKNIKGFKNYKVINSDIAGFDEKVDTVVMNPPFGVQKRKADKVFLETAMRYSDKIYSIHKIQSKKFIKKLIEDNNFDIFGIVEKKFAVKRAYKFHVKDRHSVDVGIWVLNRHV